MPDSLKEFRLTVSTSTALNMSIDEVEEKFNMGQLIIMSTIQKISFDEDEEERNKKPRQRVRNKGKSVQDRNRDAFRKL